MHAWNDQVTAGSDRRRQAPRLSSAKHRGRKRAAEQQDQRQGRPIKWNPSELEVPEVLHEPELHRGEGSWGIHNYYVRALVVQKADKLAIQAGKTPRTVMLKVSKTSVKKNTKVTFSGTESPARPTVPCRSRGRARRASGATGRTSSSAAGKYSIKVKMTSTGTFYFKALLPRTRLPGRLQRAGQVA